MSEKVTVNFSGPALAFLLFENVKSKFAQEGFLLGETNVIVTKTITDSESQNLKLHKVININAVVPCPKNCAFYNSIGGIDPEKLEDILGSEVKNVVAWYKYEQENEFKLSVREKIIHRELSTSGLFPIPTDLFTCCILSSTNSQFSSTHAYVHTFLRYYNRQFINVPLHISNLGELSNCYKPKIEASKPFSELCQSVGVPKTGVHDFQLIDKIQDKLYVEMTDIMDQLSNSESLKDKLEEEYQNMQLEKEHYVGLLSEKFVDEEKRKTCTSKTKHMVQLRKEIINLIDLKQPHLKNDLDLDKKKIKTEKRLSGDEDLIDLTAEEEQIDRQLAEGVPKISYANMAKKKA